MDLKKWGSLLVCGCFLGAQSLTDDPVMRARSQRAQAQGIDEADLPPVPRTVLEPPPLPPPEIHAKDSPHARAAKTARRGGRSTKRAKGGVAAQGSKPVGHSQAARPLGKTARKPGKRVKP